MKIKEKNNILLASRGPEGRFALLYAHKAINYLECFANMVIFIQNRLKDEGLLSEDVVGKFGFTVNEENYWCFLRTEEKLNAFLINYFLIERDRREKGKPIIRGRGRGNPSDLVLWTTQVHSILVDCAIGCLADCKVDDRNFAGYIWWFNKIRGVANKYMYELNHYRNVLCLRPGENRITSLKEDYGLRIYHVVDRGFLKGT